MHYRYNNPTHEYRLIGPPEEYLIFGSDPAVFSSSIPLCIQHIRNPPRSMIFSLRYNALVISRTLYYISVNCNLRRYCAEKYWYPTAINLSVVPSVVWSREINDILFYSNYFYSMCSACCSLTPRMCTAATLHRLSRPWRITTSYFL
jgi:hypothetical protein